MRATLRRAYRPDQLANNGVQFVQNATSDYDHGIIATLPTNFGSVEFTYEIVVDFYQIATIGPTTTNEQRRTNWTTSADEPAGPGQGSWWFRGNFLLDGHNNSGNIGSCDIQIYNASGGGNARWLFNDNDSGIASQGTNVWGIQNTGGRSLLDGNRHVIALIRRWSGLSDADLELWVDGVLQATVTSGSRTNMWSDYWQNWTGFPSSGLQDGWFIAAEKLCAIGDISDYEDFKGIVRSMAWFNGAKTSGELQGIYQRVNTSHPDYLDHFLLNEGTGTTCTSAQGLTMSLNNAQGGGFWP